MGTDRARRSYDASRMYRSVVTQQGRVTVEADANEAEEIRAEGSRAELTDIVGPTGTPDNGFKISVPSNVKPFDFAIAEGVLYLGGVRVLVKEEITYLGQPATEWADYPAGAPSPYPRSETPFTELVYLAVTEQEVSAVEDPALREVALGGPDTAARTRLIQRVHRAPMIGTACEAALDRLLKETSPGLVLDPETTRLVPLARLKVDFGPDPGAPDLCQPTAQAGFLGAENQLIRVQVTSGGTLLWGYDNASFLYRVTVTDATTLALQGTPVDVYHWPKAKQWVEVLGTAVNLGADAYVASEVGLAREISGYDSTGKILTLQTALPAGLIGRQMFLRVWESELTLAGDGTTATELVTAAGSSTGLLVYTRGPAVPGDYWMIGVRPGVVGKVFPERLRQFQPPDGPSRWATPLATIAWNADLTTASVHDCRRPFDNLVELTRHQCCELKVGPGDDAQTILTKRLRWNADNSITAMHVRFAAGQFNLDKPLLLESLNGGDLTVSGCGTKLLAATGEVALLLNKWDSANVFDLSVEATVAQAGRGSKPRPDVPQDPSDRFRHLGGAVTFLNCRSSTIERVDVACGSGVRRAASCVTIRNAGNQPGHARVRSCEFLVGISQIGVLLVNVDRATVDDNLIGLHATAPAGVSPDLLKRRLISNIGVGGALPRVAEPRVVKRSQLAAFYGLHYVTDDTLAEAWTAVLAKVGRATELPDDRPARPKRNRKAATRKDRRRIQRVISSALAQIVERREAGLLTPELLRPFLAWLDREEKRPELLMQAAGQGIVVGGVQARDVRVVNNTIAGVMDGIHIGLSTRGARGTPLFADRVQVVGNTILLQVPRYEGGAHAGVLLGNVTIATVRDNRIEVSLSNEESPVTRRADGIRVWGVPGRMLLVAGNCTEHADTGIHVVQVRSPETDSLLLVTQNLAVDAKVPIDASNVTIAPDNVGTPS